MATGTISNAKVYDDLMVGGFYEKLTQNINAFNGVSNGAILLRGEFSSGDYAKRSFFKNMSALSRRDDTSTSAATATAITMDENITVKRKVKYLVEATRDMFRSQGLSPENAALMAGQAMADEYQQTILNQAMAAVNAALSGVSDWSVDVSALGTGNTVSHINLNKMFAQMGDRSGDIRLLVMTGACYHSLMGSALAEMKFNDSGVSLYAGSIPTFGRPVLVTDAPALVSGTSTFNIMGLTEGAIDINQSETPDVVVQQVTGNENIVTRYQGEAAYNLGVKGFKWDTGNGGRNPTDSAVATATNWDQTATSNKNLAGVRLVVAQA